jgi:hypothetical protein
LGGIWTLRNESEVIEIENFFLDHGKGEKERE